MDKENKVGKKAFLTFFVIVILLSVVVETMICRGGPEWLYIVLMWIPALAATVANCVSFRENREPFSAKKLLAKGGFRKCKLRYVLLGCLLPLVYLLIPYMVYWRLYPENFAYHGVSLMLVLKDILPVMVMKVTYEHKPAMTFIGYSTSIRPEEGYQKCPEFWDREYAQKYARLWQTMKPETEVEAAILENGVGLFAICDEKAGSFEYWIAGLYQGGKVPEGLRLYTFPESDWAMFSAKGPLPSSLQTLNTQVWQEWYPTEGQKYMGNGNAMLEVYSPGDMQSPDYECGIWVPICKPIDQNEYEAAEIVSTMMITGIL